MSYQNDIKKYSQQINHKINKLTSIINMLQVNETDNYINYNKLKDLVGGAENSVKKGEYDPSNNLIYLNDGSSINSVGYIELYNKLYNLYLLYRFRFGNPLNLNTLFIKLSNKINNKNGIKVAANKIYNESYIKILGSYTFEKPLYFNITEINISQVNLNESTIMIFDSFKTNTEIDNYIEKIFLNTKTDIQKNIQTDIHKISTNNDDAISKDVLKLKNPNNLLFTLRQISTHIIKEMLLNDNISLEKIKNLKKFIIDHRPIIVLSKSIIVSSNKEEKAQDEIDYDELIEKCELIEFLNDTKTPTYNVHKYNNINDVMYIRHVTNEIIYKISNQFENLNKSDILLYGDNANLIQLFINCLNKLMINHFID